MDSHLSLRDYFTAALLFIVVLAVILVPRYISAQVARSALEIGCTSARANILQLHAIERNGVIITEIARSLGLPVKFPPPIEIPEVPIECTDL